MSDYERTEAGIAKFIGQQIDDWAFARIVAYVEERGRGRRTNDGRRGDVMNSIDWCLGAAAVFFALGRQDQIPAQWVFGPMIGMDPLDAPKPTSKPEGELVADDPCPDCGDPLAQVEGTLILQCLNCARRVYMPLVPSSRPISDAIDKAAGKGG